MPLTSTRIQKYRKNKSAVADWNNFRRGLNTLLKETEIGEDELAQATNIVLIGKGVPTKRWGYSQRYMSGFTGSVRGLIGYYTASGGNELVAITDHGFLTIQNNASYTERAGVSWSSGNNVDMTQLDDDVYIVNGQREVVRYSTPTLTGFPTLSQPTSVFATQISGASGLEVYSYRVSSKSPVGETLATTAFAVADQPQDATAGTVLVQWSGISTASVDLTGYNIYGRNEGDERFMGSVGPNTTEFFDDGSSQPAEFIFPPTADSTGGVVAKYIERFQDRLVYAGIAGEPSKLVISGRVPFHERTDIASGGNFVRIEPDAGDDITGLGVFGDRIIVFKENSIWEVVLSTITVSNFVITVPNIKLITGSRGCISGRSIVAVENDIFFLTRQGVYVLGYEPNLAIDVLRTNELSATIRPFFTNLTTSEKQNATAAYFDFKYIISFPGRDESMIYDRERVSWIGPWTFDSNSFLTYFDSSNDQKFLYGSDNVPDVFELASTKGDDAGATIVTTLRTRNEDFKDWTLFKLMKDIYFNLRNVVGSISIDIRLQDRAGQTVAAKSFSISTSAGNAGWGADQWANTQWADSEEAGGAADIADIVKWVHLYKTARRIQYVIKTSNRNDNYELLNIRTTADPAGRGIKGSDWLVT